MSLHLVSAPVKGAVDFNRSLVLARRASPTVVSAPVKGGAVDFNILRRFSSSSLPDSCQPPSRWLWISTKGEGNNAGRDPWCQPPTRGLWISTSSTTQFASSDLRCQPPSRGLWISTTIGEDALTTIERVSAPVKGAVDFNKGAS